MRRAAILCCFMLLPPNLALGEQEREGPIVETKTGKIQGFYVEEAKVFKSIPYGSSVAGSNRWKDPKPHETWNGVLKTINDPPGCPQVCELPRPEYTCPQTTDENCLYLNVFTPRHSKQTSNLSVLVFFHGGSFDKGYAGSRLYDGRFLANQTNIIVVTVNYRLGAFGFLVYGKGDQALTGNYGVKDQRLALEWVRDNICEFGGNPADVTLGGQSAGGISALVHMLSARSTNLFHRVILQSVPFEIPFKTRKQAKDLGKLLAEKLGCKKLKCLYSKSYSSIVEAAMEAGKEETLILQNLIPWGPVVDKEEVVGQPLKILEKAQQPLKPILMGTTSEEGIIFIYESFPEPLTAFFYEMMVATVAGSDTNTILRLYPSNYDTDDQRNSLSAFTTHYFFTCPIYHAANSITKSGSTSAPVYLYVFDHPLSFEGWGKDNSQCNGHACHGVELTYLWGTVKLAGFNFTANEENLSHDMMQYWGNFVMYGNPNGLLNNHQELQHWPNYSQNNSLEVMTLTTPKNYVKVVSNHQKTACSAMEKIGT